MFQFALSRSAQGVFCSVGKVVTSMKTRTEYTFKCMVKLMRVVCTALEGRQTLRRRVGNLAWGGCFLLLTLYLLSFNAVLAVLSAVLGVAMLGRYVLFYHLMAWGVSRGMTAEQRDTRYCLENKQIVAFQKRESAAYPYKDCAHLLETSDAVYYVTAQGQTILLDKRNLEGGSGEDLRACLEQKTGKRIQKLNY